MELLISLFDKDRIRFCVFIRLVGAILIVSVGYSLGCLYFCCVLKALDMDIKLEIK